MKRSIRLYPSSVYPVENWLYRIEDSDAKNSSTWMIGGHTKSKTIEKAIQMLGYKPFSITIENGR